MAYTNKSFESPVAFPDGRDVFYGAATDGEGITADIGDVPRYSFYFSSDGTSFFFKARTGDDANSWDKLSSAVVTPETDKERFAVATALSASHTEVASRFRLKEATVSLGALIIRGKVRTAATTLEATLTTSRTRINMGPAIGVETALTAECTPVKNPI